VLTLLSSFRGIFFLASRSDVGGDDQPIFLNQRFTYATSGCGARIWRGLLSLLRGLRHRAFINIAIARWLFFKSLPYWPAGLAARWSRSGISLDGVLHLGRLDRPEALMLPPPEPPTGAGRMAAGRNRRRRAVRALCAHRATHRKPWRTTTVRSVGYFLGTEHPPGYPLFTAHRHLFTYLPFGSVAIASISRARFLARSPALRLAMRARPDPRAVAGVSGGIGLGVSPVSGRSPIIARSTTLNTFFLLVWYSSLRRLRLLHNSPRLRSRGAFFRHGAYFWSQPEAIHWPLMLLGRAGLRGTPVARSGRVAAGASDLVVAGGSFASCPTCGW